MKVSVITRHAITNYGSFLQAYATQEVVEQLGHSCELIDYIRTDETYRNIEKTVLKLKPEWNSSGLKRFAYRVMREPESRIAGKRFELYRNRHLKLTRRYSSGDDLKANPPVSDCYITGSDQVWGPIGADQYDDNYFLSFVEDSFPKFSYAASFGRSSQDTDTENHFKSLLQRYDELLVREDSAVERIEAMGLNAKQVIDPTLLLSRDYWTSKIQEFSKSYYEDRRPYILIYQLHNNNRLNEYASELAKRNHLDLVRISSSIHQITRGGKFIYCPDPFTFLNLIKEATCMVTDSFHGTAFAINLNTQFVEVLPQNGTSTRNASILKLTGLSGRILGESNDYSLFDQEIDYNAVNSILLAERNKSISVFREMLNRVK